MEHYKISELLNDSTVNYDNRNLWQKNRSK